MDETSNIKFFQIKNRVFAVSKVNGKVIRLLKPFDETVENLFVANGFLKSNDFKVDMKPKTITMSINIVNECNLNCKYCFNTNKTKKQLTFEQCTEFIDIIISKNIDANRFIVDLSGSGEPLLALDLILKISEFCRQKSNEIKKEVLVMFATNGTLLTPNVAKLLKENLVLFGISLDGIKKDNCNRVDFKGVNCYSKVMKNVKRLENRDYVGVAITLHSEKQNLIKIVKKMIKYFETISIKPVRNNYAFGISKDNISKIEDNYEKFTDFLIKKTLYKKDTRYLKAILNGEDYFGKYLYKIILNQRIISRCDIGHSRYSLGIDGKIYGCPALVGIKEVNLSEGLSVIRSFKCEDCYIRFLCGGECMANSYSLAKNFETNDEVMCRLKKKIFELGYYFVSLLKENTKIHNEILSFSIKKRERDYLNEEIQNQMFENNISFINAKIKYDNRN